MLTLRATETISFSGAGNNAIITRWTFSYASATVIPKVMLMKNEYYLCNILKEKVIKLVVIPTCVRR